MSDLVIEEVVAVPRARLEALERLALDADWWCRARRSLDTLAKGQSARALERSCAELSRLNGV